MGEVLRNEIKELPELVQRLFTHWPFFLTCIISKPISHVTLEIVSATFAVTDFSLYFKAI